MPRRTRRLFLLVVGVLAAASGCGGGARAGADRPASAEASQPGGSARPGNRAAGTTGSEVTRVDMDALFPHGPGRDLVLNNCQNCHTFVPIVILQMNEDEWTRSSVNHRERVPALTDGDFTTLYTYLKANFNPSRPVPKLPKELLATWTAY